LALDGLFDVLVTDFYRPKAPDVLYHYTDWAGARGILCGQHFWETAHDCTNDEAELVSAHSVIVEVAETLRKSAVRAAARTLDLFLNSYPRLQVNKLKTIYLACFTLARDDQEQWRKYADDGRGLCLGLRILNEPPSNPKGTGSALVQVEYSEEAWRDHLMTNFGKVCDLLSLANVSNRNIDLGSSALYRIAAFASIMAKQAKWAVEREFRHVTLIRDGGDIQPKERKRGEKAIRYLDDVELREGGKQLAFAEIIVGPNQNASEAQTRLTALLAEAGYEPGSFEYPSIEVSQVRWNSALEGLPAPPATSQRFFDCGAHVVDEHKEMSLLKTTYVFGAGASIHAHYPLSSKMGEGLLDFMLNFPIDRYKRSAEFLIESFGKSPNIEEMITVLEERIDALKGAESAKDRATRSVFGTAHGHIAEMLREWFRGIRNNPANTASLYAEFVEKVVKPGDTVVTFNYDDSLDRELGRVGLWDLSRGYGFDLGSTDTRSEVSILKLHGSINWIISLFGGVVSGPAFAGPQGAFGGSPVIHLADAAYLGYPQFSGRTYAGGGTTLSLILPGRNKQFVFDTSLGPEFKEFWGSLWSQAADSLEKSDRLVICGYSMPSADSRARELLLKTCDKKTQVTIVSGTQSETIADQFRIEGFRNVGADRGGHFEDWLQSQRELAASA
jgi:hypothetical protein